jgi:tetratricopeptide (TPR) repeat protein
LKVSSRFPAAEAAFARSAEEASLGTGDLEVAVYRLECLASLRLRQAKLREAIALFCEAANFNEKLGDQHGLAEDLMAAAGALAERGDPQEALRLQTRANQLINRRADPRLSLIGRHNGIQFILGMGRHREAWKLMEESEPYYDAAGDDLILLQRRHLRGKIAREFGSQAMDEIAEQELRGTAQEAIERGMPYLAAKCLLELAGFYADRGRHLLLPGLIDEILPIFEALGVDRESLAARVLKSAAEDRARAAVLLRTAAEHLAAVAGY